MNRGAQLITKDEYDADHTRRAKEKMQKFFDEDDLGSIFDWARNNDNVYSIKALGDLMGVELDKTWKRRKEQLIEYYGDKYTKWQEKVAEEAAEKERNEAASRSRRGRTGSARQKRTGMRARLFPGRNSCFCATSMMLMFLLLPRVY